MYPYSYLPYAYGMPHPQMLGRTIYGEQALPFYGSNYPALPASLPQWNLMGGPLTTQLPQAGYVGQPIAAAPQAYFPQTNLSEVNPNLNERNERLAHQIQ